jgi:hypothetical protein
MNAHYKTKQIYNLLRLLLWVIIVKATNKRSMSTSNDIQFWSQANMAILEMNRRGVILHKHILATPVTFELIVVRTLSRLMLKALNIIFAEGILPIRYGI